MSVLVNKSVLVLGGGVLVVAVVFGWFFYWLFSVKFLTNVPVERNTVWREGFSKLGLLSSKFSARYFYSYEKNGGLYARFGYRAGTSSPRWVDAFLGGRMGNDEYLLPVIYIGSDSSKPEKKIVSEAIRYTKGSKLPLRPFAAVTLNYIYKAVVDKAEFGSDLDFCNKDEITNNFCMKAYLVSSRIKSGANYEEFYQNRGSSRVEPLIITGIETEAGR